ncbi:MAG TPA: hypothetical protein DCX27_18355 [Balneola sp.]|nr:hypothetical protein [Balneola sp.]|tara:strand:+ start:74 stop:937 length:864 start_codon:yes stop_codon:yes gene_type:complete
MSRNQDRLGLEDDLVIDDDVTAQAATQPTSPGFSWSVPTEFVELPSQGKFYPPGHPVHGKLNIEIRFMTAKEEDILTSKSLLKQGIALDRMLQNIIADKTVRVNDLLIGDKNALLVAARRTGYGPEYDTNVACPNCGETVEYSFDISEPPINNYMQEAEDYQVLIDDNGRIHINLPMSSVDIVCRLMTGADELAVVKEAERKSKKKMQSATATDSFRSYIVSVNGDTSPFTIESFIQAMPARDARHLRTIYSKVVPNIDLTQNFDCSNCGHEADMEVPLGVDFFWPK